MSEFLSVGVILPRFLPSGMTRPIQSENEDKFFLHVVEPIEELEILWLTAGLSCDGDTVPMTAATQPSIEDIVLGTIPGLPKVRLHNPFLAYEVGDDFLHVFHLAADGRGLPFLLIVEGSIPNEHNKVEGYWASLGTDAKTGQPITTCEWVDRLAPHAWGVIAAGTCAAYGGIHAMQGNPTGCMGLTQYLGEGWKSKAGIPVVCVPGCPVQPDNMTSTILYLLYHAAGRAPMIPLDEGSRPTWLFQSTVHEGCDRGGYYEQGQFAEEYGDPTCIVKLGCWGPVVQCNVGKRAAYLSGGAVFITWDEAAKGDGPIGMIVLSPFAKGNGYQNSISYTHSSTLKTLQETFGVTPLLGDAANEPDLSDLFSAFP